MHAAIAANLEASAPWLAARGTGSHRAPHGGGGAGAVELLQQEAGLAARLFAAAGRRPPSGVRQVAAGCSEEAARFSVPVGRMGDYLEVSAEHHSVCCQGSVHCSPDCLLSALMDRAGGARRQRGVRRCGTRRWTTTSAPGSTATPLATRSCATSAQRLARSPALVRLAVQAGYRLVHLPESGQPAPPAWGWPPGVCARAVDEAADEARALDQGFAGGGTSLLPRRTRERGSRSPAHGAPHALRAGAPAAPPVPIPAPQARRAAPDSHCANSCFMGRCWCAMQCEVSFMSMCVLQPAGSRTLV